MDFLKDYDARGAAEIPVELELRDPATGDVIMNGKKPCVVLVKGASSRSMQESIRQEAAERARKIKDADGAGDDDKGDNQLVSDLHESTCKSAARLVAGFVNMQTRGPDGPRDLTLEDVPVFLDLNFFSLAHAIRKADDPAWRHPSFAQQIIDAATDDSRFLAKQRKG